MKLSDEIVHQLENLIVNNELNVGDALPPERELAAQLGVSRNILREAISTMVQKGLLEVRQGSGTYVASPSVELLRDSLSFFVRFSDSGLFDLLEARFALEVQIADLAARRSTPEDVSRIAACYDDLKHAVDDPDRYIEADIRFHAALARAAKNEILLLLLELDPRRPARERARPGYPPPARRGRRHVLPPAHHPSHPAGLGGRRPRGDAHAPGKRAPWLARAGIFAL